MANHPSAAKRNRQRIVRTVRNKEPRSNSAVRTAVKKARNAIEASGPDAKALVEKATASPSRRAARAPACSTWSTNVANDLARIRAALHKQRLRLNFVPPRDRINRG